jgi:hypothetical protein
MTSAGVEHAETAMARATLDHHPKGLRMLDIFAYFRLSGSVILPPHIPSFGFDALRQASVPPLREL